MLFAIITISLGLAMGFGFSARDFQVDAPDFGRARAEGLQLAEIGREAKTLASLRDLARGQATDLSTPQGRDAFRAEAYKIDPVVASKFETVLGNLDENGRARAKQMRESGGRAYLQILNAPEAVRPQLWAAAGQNPEYGKLFQGQYSPAAIRGLEGEFLDFDKALGLYLGRERSSDLQRAVYGDPSAAAPPAAGGTIEVETLPAPDGSQASIAQAGGYRSKLRAPESGGNDRAENPFSTADGRYQFIDATWEDLGMGGKDKMDPRNQEEALSRLLDRNAKSLRGFLGRDPTDAEQYAAHWFGAANARQVLSARPDTPIERLIGNGAASTNGLSGMTAGEVRSLLTERMGTGSTWQQANQPAPSAPSAPAGTAPASGPDTRGGGLSPTEQRAFSIQLDDAIAAGDANKVAEIMLKMDEAGRRDSDKAAKLVTLVYPNGSKVSFDENRQQPQIASALREGAIEDRQPLVSTGDKAFQTYLADQLKDGGDAARAAQQTLLRLNIAKTAVNNYKNTGLAGDYRLAFEKAAQALGLPNNAAAGEVVRSFQTQLAVLQRAPGSGATSDFEMGLYLSAVPGLNTSQQTNIAMIEIGDRLARRQISEFQRYRDYVAKNDTDAGFEFNLEPVLSPAETELLMGMASGVAPNGGAGAAPADDIGAIERQFLRQ